MRAMGTVIALVVCMRGYILCYRNTHYYFNIATVSLPLPLLHEVRKSLNKLEGLIGGRALWPTAGQAGWRLGGPG